MNKDQKKRLVLDEAHIFFPKMTEESKKIQKELYELGKPIGYQLNTVKQKLEK